MNELYQYLSSESQAWNKCAASRSEFIRVSETWRSQISKKEETKHIQISKNDLDNWLHKRKKYDTLGEVHTCVLKMVWIVHTPSKQQFSISSPELDNIIQHFGVRLAYEYCNSCFLGVEAFPPVTAANRQIRTFSISYHPKFMTTWSRDASENITQGLCFAEDIQISAFEKLLDIAWYLADHDMMVAFLCSVILGGQVESDKDIIKQDVREVEVRTGYHRWSSRSVQPAPGDLAALSAQMSGCSTKLASMVRKIRFTDQLNEFIMKHLQDPLSKAKIDDESASTSCLSGATSVARRLQSNIELLQRRSNMRMAYADFILQRVQVQINALENLTAQNDALVSLAVGKDSKIIAMASQQDSSSMKILTVVTVCFLPGMFVAAVFAMPLFDWDADHDVIKPGFNVYWAVALPLTVTTLILCGLWIYSQRRGRKQVQNKYNDSTDGEIRLSEVGALSVKKKESMIW